jgi:hypothetical protein
MTPLDNDVILDAFAAEPVHDRSTLERYVREYPLLSEELVDLAAELRFCADNGGTEEGVVSDPKLNTAWENFLAAGAKPVAAVAAVDIFAQFKGPAFAVLAGKLDIPRSILTAVRDRLIVPTSVPIGFIRRFSEATSTTVEEVKTYLGQTSQAPVGLAFKSDQKPSQQGQATFRQLLETTAMSESQRLLLLRECQEHELT